MSRSLDRRYERIIFFSIPAPFSATASRSYFPFCTPPFINRFLQFILSHGGPALLKLRVPLSLTWPRAPPTSCAAPRLLSSSLFRFPLCIPSPLFDLSTTFLLLLHSFIPFPLAAYCAVNRLLLRHLFSFTRRHPFGLPHLESVTALSSPPFVCASSFLALFPCVFGLVFPVCSFIVGVTYSLSSTSASLVQRFVSHIFPRLF